MNVKKIIDSIDYLYIKNKLMKRYFLFLILITIIFTACKKYDTTAPIIKLKGESTLYVPLDSAYNEPGADIFDNKDKNLTYQIDGTVNIHKAGNYVLTYTAVDGDDNYALPVRRTVIVFIPFVSIAGDYVCDNYKRQLINGQLSSDSTYLRHTGIIQWWDKTILAHFGGLLPDLNVAVDITGETSQKIIIPEKIYNGYKISGTGRISDDGKTINISYIYTDSFYHIFYCNAIWYKQ
jgi:hypothetical protein